MALNMTITMIKKHQEQNGNFETIQTMSEARQKYDTSRKTLIDLCKGFSISKFGKNRSGYSVSPEPVSTQKTDHLN
jgi:hypothetical protein